MAVGEETNIVKYLRAIMASVQDVENALQQLYANRRIDTAEGVQLDALGKIVGQLRGELDDDAYRRYIRARIKTNRSNGLVNDLIRIAELILDNDDIDIIVKSQQIATVVVELNGAMDFGDLVPNIVRDFLKQAVAAGVRLILEYSPADPAVTFAFAKYGGADPDVGRPFDSEVGGATSPGQFAGALD